MGIAFDAHSNAAANPLNSWNHTCSGSNRLLLVGFRSPSTTLTASYNGVAMTRLGTYYTLGAGDYDHVFYLLNPASGTNSITTSSPGSGTTYGQAVSYTGVKQSGQPNASSSAHGSSTSPSTSVDTGTTDGCWIMAWMDNEVSATSADSNTTFVWGSSGGSASTMGWFEYKNNPKSPAGSQSVGGSLASSGSWFISAVSFTPDSFVPTTSIKTVNGLAKASMKTFNGIASESIKTINGLASLLRPVTPGYQESRSGLLVPDAVQFA
jgi:hypothetical protein